MKHCFLTLLFFWLAACSTGPRLSVQRHIETEEDRASTFVGSPDPTASEPLTEKLFIWWKIPKRIYRSGTSVALELLYGDLHKERRLYSLSSSRGLLEHAFSPEMLDTHNGLLTYKVEIVSPDRRILRDFKNFLWFEKISVD